MLMTVKILKRKDASSIVVAVVIAMIIGTVLPTLTSRLAGFISGAGDGDNISYSPPGADWQAQYLQPIVWVVLQLALLEAILWLYVMVKTALKK